MKTFGIGRATGFLAMIAVLMSAAAGCSSSGRASESVKAVSSMDEVYASLGKATAQVNKSNALLDQLTHGGDLPETFKQYTASVSELQQARDDAAARGKSFRENRDAYLAKWGNEVASLENPDVKEGAAQQHERVRARFDEVSKRADEVRAAYQPYMKDLTEIQKALSMDLTPNGVKALQPAIERAKMDGDMLSKKLDALGIELNTLRGKMTPSGK